METGEKLWGCVAADQGKKKLQALESGCYELVKASPHLTGLGLALRVTDSPTNDSDWSQTDDNCAGGRSSGLKIVSQAPICPLSCPPNPL